MYQWIQPHTGTVQLAGAPPPWYRSGQAGPRVVVFEHGRLVDDTQIAVPEERRMELRRQAFGPHERNATGSRGERNFKQLRATLKSEASRFGLPSAAMTMPPPHRENTVNEMKEFLDAWDTAYPGAAPKSPVIQIGADELGGDLLPTTPN